MLAGVFIRTGCLLASGKRVVYGLVHRFGTLNFISDNAGCFGDRPLPRNGCLITFGEYEVYVATELPAASSSTCSSLPTHLLSVRLAAGVSLAP